jgi:hypothetical protein
MRSITRCTFATILLMLPLALGAVPLHWTAVASTGTIDPLSNGIYVFAGAGLTYNSSGALTTILARYNVTNTTGTETPAWTTLEMGFTDPTSGGAVSARLFQVDPCTGSSTQLCQIASVTATQSCRSCTFSASSINFSTNLYYVLITINRSATNQLPVLYTLRIF